MDHTRSPGPPLAAIAIWIGLQLAALLLGTWEVPLSDNYVRPAERGAIEVMLVVEVAAAAAMFPSLLSGMAGLAAATAVTWPLLYLAGILSGTPDGRIGMAELYITLWLGGLALWGRVAPGERSRLMMSVAALVWSLGAAVLWYLHNEFGSALQQTPLSAQLWQGPALGALRVIEDDTPWPGSFGAIGVALTIGLLVACAGAWKHRRGTGSRAALAP